MVFDKLEALSSDRTEGHCEDGRQEGNEGKTEREDLGQSAASESECVAQAQHIEGTNRVAAPQTRSVVVAVAQVVDHASRLRCPVEVRHQTVSPFPLTEGSSLRNMSRSV